MTRRRALVLLVALLGVGRPAGAQEAGGGVVLSEVGRDDHGGFVEFHNPGSAPVALRGWRLLGDVKHLFEAGSAIPPGGFLVLRSRREATATRNAPGWWNGRLRRKGGSLTLLDAGLRPVDRVTLRRWTVPGQSLQRVGDTASWSWGAPTPGGPPPGTVVVPPLLLERGRCEPSLVRSIRPLAVAVRVRSAEPARVKARWASVRSSGEVPLTPSERDGAAQWHRGEIPPLPDQVLVRVTFVAEAGTATAELSQDEGEKPLQSFVYDGIDTPLPVYCFDVPPARREDLMERPERERFPATLVIVEGGRATFSGDVTVQIRGGTWTRAWLKKNWVVNFPRRTHPGAPAQINLRSEWHDPTALREMLGLELFREAGVPAPEARHVRLQINGEPAGLFLEVEMVDERFLARNGLPGGALYQAVVAKHQSGPERCYGRAYPTLSGYESHWTKRTRRDEPYDDLAAFIDGFHACTTSEQLRDYFARHLDVERYVNYLAVSSFITHWDSTVKNYYWCRDVATDRWTVIPWDLDRTWGDHFEGWGYAGAAPLEGTQDEPTDPSNRKWWNWLQDRFLAVPEYRRLTLSRISQLTYDFPATRLDPEIQQHVATLRREILLDRSRWGGFKHASVAYDTYERGPFVESDLDEGVEKLTGYVHARLTNLRRSCAEELARMGGGSVPRRAEEIAAAPRPPAPGTRWILLIPVAVVLYLAGGYGTEDRRL